MSMYEWIEASVNYSLLVLYSSWMAWRACSVYKRLYKLDAQYRPWRSRDSGPLASASRSNTANLVLHNGDNSVKYFQHHNK